jgi:hypothetical protein
MFYSVWTSALQFFEKIKQRKQPTFFCKTETFARRRVTLGRKPYVLIGCPQSKQNLPMEINRKPLGLNNA